MKQYKKLFIGLTMLMFVSCGGSGGGGSKEILKKDETSTVPVIAKSGEIKTSNGNISIGDENEIAMTAENGGQVINGEDGIISGVFTIGMEASGINSGAVNNGKVVGGSSVNTARAININSNENIKRIGMKVSNGGKVINNGEISGKLSEGIVAEKEGIGTNNGEISSIGIEYMTVYTEDGIEYNERRTEGIGMRASDGGHVINGESGVISGTISEGMRAEKEGSTAVNNGTISSTGVEWTKTYTGTDGIEYNETGTGARGMRAANGGSVVNGKDGLITGTLSEGMKAEGEGSIAVNYGEINSTGAGWSKIYTDKDGVKHTELGTKVNGIYVFSGATAINKETGIINLNSEEGIGMYADDVSYNQNLQLTSIKSKVENYGTINVNAQNGTGMRVSNGGSAINGETGVINLNSSNGIGMYATGAGSTIENHGKIYLSGSREVEGYLIDEEIKTSGEIINGKDSKGNIGMKIENGAKMINKGRITFGK